MRKWLFLLLIFCLGILQLSPLGVLTLFNLKPDLLLIAALTSVFFLEFKYAFFLSVFCGLFKDVFLLYPFTLNTFTFVLWSYLVFKIAKEISTENTFVKVGLVFLLALLQNIITGIVGSYSGVIPLGIYLRLVLFGSIYTAAVSPIVFKLAKIILDR